MNDSPAARDLSMRSWFSTFLALFIPFLLLLMLLGGGTWLLEFNQHREDLEKEARHQLGLLENALRREVFSLALNPLFFATRMRGIGLESADWFAQVNQGMREITSLTRWMKEESAYQEVRILDTECHLFWRIRRQNAAVFAERAQGEQGEKQATCLAVSQASEQNRSGGVWVAHAIQEDSPGHRIGTFEVMVPVHSRLGERVGALSVVFTLEALTERLVKRFEFGRGHFFLIGPQGEWLFEGVVRAHETVRSAPWRGAFRDRFPAVWAGAQHATQWQTRVRDGYFTVLSMDDAKRSAAREQASFGNHMSEKELFFSGIRLAIHYPAPLFDLPRLRDLLIFLFGIFFPLGALGCWRLALVGARRRYAETAMRQERDKLTTIILGAQEGIVVTNPAGEVVLVNPAAERLLDKSSDDIMRQGFIALIDDPAYLAALLDHHVKRDLPDIVVYKGRILKLHVASITTSDGRSTGSAALLRDITEEKRLEEQLRNLSTIDGLTGLLNRRRFDELLQEEMHRCKRYKMAIGVILVDVDHFKQFNDQHGHDQGDRVLQAVARTLRHSARDVDLVARYGGEEFILLLPNTNYPGANFVAERLRLAVERLLVDGLRVTISLGIAMYPVPVDGEVKDLVKVADQALYEAKRRGRNHACFAKTKSIIEDVECGRCDTV